ncbi:DUF4276 family protein, partial [Dermacoccus sp. Ellin185]|uniref:DUF4276 family protein n=1 Tax=Dermacoccus sp. Ellin185 TaxID=188626 RepID=UPI001111B851
QVGRALNPYLSRHDMFAIPTIAKTKSTPTGSHKGGAPWHKYVPLACALAAQPDKAAVGILMDFYGVPRDTPGFDAERSGAEYREVLLGRMREKVNSFRVQPHLIMHEFETLVFAAIDAGARSSLTDAELGALRDVIRNFGGDIEAINGSIATSPSHRLTAACRTYVKTATGISLLDEVPFDDILERCPTFAQWLSEIVAAAHNHAT